jgi:hypothetical protein
MISSCQAHGTVLATLLYENLKPEKGVKYYEEA